MGHVPLRARQPSARLAQLASRLVWASLVRRRATHHARWHMNRRRAAVGSRCQLLLVGVVLAVVSCTSVPQPTIEAAASTFAGASTAPAPSTPAATDADATDAADTPGPTEIELSEPLPSPGGTCAATQLVPGTATNGFTFSVVDYRHVDLEQPVRNAGGGCVLNVPAMIGVASATGPFRPVPCEQHRLPGLRQQRLPLRQPAVVQDPSGTVADDRLFRLVVDRRQRREWVAGRHAASVPRRGQRRDSGRGAARVGRDHDRPRDGHPHPRIERPLAGGLRRPGQHPAHRPPPRVRE